MVNTADRDGLRTRGCALLYCGCGCECGS